MPIVVLPESIAETCRLDTDDGIGFRIERRGSAQHLDGDDRFLDFAGPAVERPLDDEAEETTRALGIDEDHTRQNALELSEYSGPVHVSGSAAGFERDVTDQWDLNTDPAAGTIIARGRSSTLM
jgi:hypothetical protein